MTRFDKIFSKSRDILVYRKVCKQASDVCLAFFRGETPMNMRQLFELKGRQRIYTDEREITDENIIKVLRSAYTVHKQNVNEIQYLIDYELGDQPLPREKRIRPDIDVQISENAANFVTEFKMGYFWGIPPVMIQHGDKEMHGTDPMSDDNGIAALNEMLQNGLDLSYENQKLSDFVEKCGIGHRLVDVKTADEFDDEEPMNLVKVCTLDSRNAFCVYYNGIGTPKVMGVTYVKTQSGKLRFTCFTKNARYEIVGWKIANPEIERQVNPLGMIPIVEYNRAIDRTGCFERHISYMDGLNMLISDFANSVAQDTQQIWWGDNVDFDVDEKTGEAIKPESGDWLLTHSPENRKASVQALASGVDGSSTLNAIAFEWNRILQKCHVPIQQESAGGGSTGTATSMSAGWQAAEVDALREESVVKRGMKEELRLILKAIELVPHSVLEADSPLRKIHAQDVDFHFNRNKNYDLSIKANTLATLINSGIHGRHAIKISEITADTESVWLDSQSIIEKKQKKMFEEVQSTSTSASSAEKEASGESAENHRTLQDSSDQQGNSPFIGSSGT